MKRQWITDTNKMNFTDEELIIVNKVIDATDTMLYFNGKDYKTEDPSDTYYFNSKDLLMEDMNYNYTELKRDGVFDEEDAPADPWLKVLEDRVAEWSLKEQVHKRGITKTIDSFKEWVNTAEECDVLYDIEWKSQAIVDARVCYKTAWSNLCKAKDELAAYKETMNY